MTDLNQDASSTVAEIFVAEVAAHLNGSSSSSLSSSTCERASYSSIVRRSIQDTRCASFIIPTPVSEPEPEQQSEIKTVDDPLVSEVENKSAAMNDETTPLEKPKLPFADSGRLVGERRYGDWVINPKKANKPVVICDEPTLEQSTLATLEQPAGSCVLL